LAWFVYILRCDDNTLYTGITNDLDKRHSQHESGNGAKYTRGRGPFEILFSESHPDKGSALRREQAIKALPRQAKLQLITRQAAAS